MNGRRTVLIFLGAAALARALPSFAQSTRIWRVGFLAPGARGESLYGGFDRGMSELGYVEGRNLMLERRYAEGRNESLPGLAGELARMPLDVIVGAGTTGARAALRATSSIPIVMVNVGDPVSSGLVKSLGRPEGNVTGLSSLNSDVTGKHLELLLRALPRVSRVAMLVNPGNPGSKVSLEYARGAARALKVTILPVEASSAQDIEAGFSKMARERAGALMVMSDATFIQERVRIAALASKHRLPSIGGSFGYAEAGGLISYGTDQSDIFRRAAAYVDKILRGAKPAELPIEQPTKFELVVNRGTAKVLGLRIPQELLVNADRVIE